MVSMATLVGVEIEYNFVLHIVSSKGEGVHTTIVTRALADKSCIYGCLSNVIIGVFGDIQDISCLISCIDQGGSNSRPWCHVLCRLGTV